MTRWRGLRWVHILTHHPHDLEAHIPRASSWSNLTHRTEPERIDTARDEGLHDRVRTSLREGKRTTFILARSTAHNDALHLRIALERERQRIQHGSETLRDPSTARAELDAIQNHDWAHLDADVPMVRATILVAHAVVRLGFVRARIAGVCTPVAIVVQVWTTIQIVHAIDVFRTTRAEVLDVDHAVLIVVRIDASIVIFEAVEILGGTRRFGRGHGCRGRACG